MEKNQQNSNARPEDKQSSTGFTANQPGQQLPDADKEQTSTTSVSEKDVQHSESSLPQSDNETLGTP